MRKEVKVIALCFAVFGILSNSVSKKPIQQTDNPIRVIQNDEVLKSVSLNITQYGSFEYSEENGKGLFRGLSSIKASSYYGIGFLSTNDSEYSEKHEVIIDPITNFVTVSIETYDDNNVKINENRYEGYVVFHTEINDYIVSDKSGNSKLLSEILFEGAISNCSMVNASILDDLGCGYASSVYSTQAEMGAGIWSLLAIVLINFLLSHNVNTNTLPKRTITFHGHPYPTIPVTKEYIATYVPRDKFYIAFADPYQHLAFFSEEAIDYALAEEILANDFTIGTKDASGIAQSQYVSVWTYDEDIAETVAYNAMVTRHSYWAGSTVKWSYYHSLDSFQFQHFHPVPEGNPRENLPHSFYALPYC